MKLHFQHQKAKHTSYILKKLLTAVLNLNPLAFLSQWLTSRVPINNENTGFL